MILNVFIILLSSIAQSASPAEEVNRVIQAHQPYIQREFLKLNYNEDKVKKTFPKFQQVGQALKYTLNENETLWQFDDKNHVKSVTFTFMKPKSKSSSERNLLIRFRNRLTPEAFAKLPSSERSLFIKEGNFELEVFLPLSDFEDPYIRSITLKGANG